ncbi:MAG: PD-(D/E)XK nuclease family protein [Victivallales bacterium]|jgi:Holliday junction resolvase-like predicted endonuclease|nr:PD-(D/E)XK nuclease family protein [Victivallales bacterium]
MNMPLFATLGTVTPAVPAPPPLAELRKRPHWSFSRINALVNYCSLAWAFRYIYRVGPRFTPVSLVFGSAFHSALAFHATRRLHGQEVTVSDCQEVFADLLTENCRREGPPVRFGEGGTVDILIAQGQRMLATYLASLDPEEEIEAVSMPFSVPLVDASGTRLDKPLIGEYDLVVRRGGIRTIVDWKTSARRWPKGKAATDLQATCYLWAEQHLRHTGSQFRFDVVTKTRVPACERHHATRAPDDFVRLGELVRVLERIVTNECFLPQTGSWECANCPCASACESWHRERARIFAGTGRPRAAYVSEWGTPTPRREDAPMASS